MAGFLDNDVTASNNTSVGGVPITGEDNVKRMDNAVRELAAQTARFALDMGGAVTAGGAADAITVTTNQTFTASELIAGFSGTFVAASDNATTTPTLNVDTTGAKVIKKSVAGVETALAAGDIQSGAIYQWFYRPSWNSSAGAYQVFETEGIGIQSALDLKAAIENVVLLDSEDDGSKNTGLLMPSGTTIQRPTTPDGVQLRYNTTESQWEGYDGSVWGAISSNLDPVINHVTTATAYAASTDREITELTTSITTTKDSANVTIMAAVSYERSQDGMFYVTRDGTEIGSHPSAGSRSVGLAPVAFDDSTGNTMGQAVIIFMDTVPAAGSVEYKFHIRGLNNTFFLNRTENDSNSNTHERGASVVILEEK